MDYESLAKIKKKIDEEKARKLRMLAKASGLGQTAKEPSQGSSNTTASDHNLVTVDTRQQNIPMDTSSGDSISKSSSGRSEEPMDEDLSGAALSDMVSEPVGGSTSSGARSKTRTSATSPSSAVSEMRNIPGVEVLQPGECVLSPEEQQVS